MKLSVSETAKLMGISVRTLHYYDDIGLLCPSEISEAGYRYYDEKKLELLQQILFYRELELPLKDILHILSQPDHDKMKALTSHRELLVLKQKHIADLLRLVDATLGGQKFMNMEQFAFADVEGAKEQYAQEVEARWGHTEAYKESRRREKKRSAPENSAMLQEMNTLFAAFADARTLLPDAPEVQDLVAAWQALITRYHYDCTNEILDGLAEMYVVDERFTQNIDRFGTGTAQFLHDAIKVYCR